MAPIELFQSSSEAALSFDKSAASVAAMFVLRRHPAGAALRVA